jgi:hypothetical protein
MLRTIIFTLLVLASVAARADQCPVPLDTVKQAMIKENLASYPGNCPCPYFSDRAGRSCGRRSAYSRPGGYAPLCYLTDITDDQAQAYCQSHNFN